MPRRVSLSAHLACGVESEQRSFAAKAANPVQPISVAATTRRGAAKTDGSVLRSPAIIKRDPSSAPARSEVGASGHAETERAFFVSASP
ncbi:hypothetical protein VTI28DRAFT_9430 [Corynascus sepedonium]